jgi:hypothetical protein
MLTRPTARTRALRLACLALVVGSPALGTAGLLRYCGYSLRNYVPGFPNDETIHYLEVQAFATRGFASGYFGLEEHAAPASFNRLGYHGPLYAIIYGTLARPFGMSYALATYLNVGVLTAAIVAYLWLTRPSNATLLLLAAFLLTYWPFYGTVFSWMQEAFHCALAVLLAGLFTALLRDPPPRRQRVLFAVTLLVVCLASLIRISWALLFPPVFLLGPGATTGWQKVRAVGLACVTILACMKVFQLLCAPFVSESWPPFSRTSFLMNKLLTGEAGAALIREHFLSNFADFLMYFRIGHVLVAGVFIQCLLFLLAVAAIQLRDEVAVLRGTEPARTDRWLALVGYNQVVITAASLIIYVIRNEGGPRLFAIHLLLGLLVAVNAPRRSLRALLPLALVLNLLLAVPSLVFLRDRYYYFERFNGRRPVDAFHAGIGRLMAFDPRADGWANTVLSDRVPMEFAGLPAGMGLEYYVDPRFLNRPVRSRYIIAPADEVRRLGRRVKFLAALPGLGGKIGVSRGRAVANLYLNLEPATPPASPR